MFEELHKQLLRQRKQIDRALKALGVEDVARKVPGRPAKAPKPIAGSDESKKARGWPKGKPRGKKEVSSAEIIHQDILQTAAT